MSTKFEQLLDYLVNEEHEKANELFHEIVVEKSRDIYENLIAEEEQEADEGAEEEQDESVDEAEEEEDESVDEGADEEADESMDLEDSYQMDGADDGFGGGEEGDATDELGAEIGAGDEEGEKSEDDAIFDIKNAIQELEAAFAELEKAQGAETGGEFGGDADGEFGGDAEEEPEDEMMGLREYRETVKDGHGAERKGRGEGEIAGANTGEKMPSGTNTKSAINANADRTKPTSGANAKNLNQGATGEGANTGTSPNAKAGGGLVGGVKGEFTKGVEKNISSSSKSSMKSGSDLGKQGTGYPGNNKSAGPVGSGTGDKAGQTSVRNDSALIKHIK